MGYTKEFARVLLNSLLLHFNSIRVFEVCVSLPDIWPETIIYRHDFIDNFVTISDRFLFTVLAAVLVREILR